MLPKLLTKFFTKKRVALLLVVCSLLSVLATSSVLAYPGQGFPSYHFTWENAVYKTDEMNLQSFVFETFKALISSVIAMIAPCFTCGPGQGYGLFGMVSTLIAGIYTHPPASGVEYLAYMGQKLNLASPAYAQGVGFTQMQPYLPLWSAFRDMSYGLFVIIFIFIGFAIMFRIKISPQAVITIESALPRIIMALLLVTFSYAIVGFMIDIMMVITNLIIFTFKSIPSTNVVWDWLKTLLPDAPITDTGRLLWYILLVGFPPILISFLVLGLLGGIGVVATVLTVGAGSFALVGLGIAALILLIVFLIALIRVLWILLKAYVMVVLSLIFSPFIIIVGALPGSNAISGWLRNLLANLAVLPTVMAMAFLAGYISLTGLLNVGLEDVMLRWLQGNNPSQAIQEMQSGVMSLGDQIVGAAVLFLVSLVILLLTPKAADIIQSFLSGKPFMYGAALGQAFGPVVSVGSFGLGVGKEAVTKGAIGAARPMVERKLSRILRIPRETPSGEVAEIAGKLKK